MLPLGSVLVLGVVARKDPMSADVITELAALFSSYLCSTSIGNEDILKLALGVYGAGGNGPVPVPARVAGVPGVRVVVAAVAAGVGATGVLNGVNAIPQRSSGMNPGMNYSLLIWNSMLA